MLRVKQELRLSNLTLRHPHPYKFVSPQCTCKALYGFWRVFWAAYHVTWVLLSWVMEPWAAYYSWERVKWFIYLTNWTYLLLALETVLEAISFFCVHTLRKDIVTGEEPREMPWYLKLQWLLYNVVTTGSLMVTAWYWAVLYKSDKELGAVRVSFHAVNSIYVLLNLLITATPTRLLHAIHPVVFGVAYTLFSALYQVCGGSNVQGEAYIYRVTDWGRPWRTLLLSSLSNFLAIPLVHLLVFLLRHLVGRLWACGRGGAGGGRGRGRGAVTCVDLGERGTESSSMQAELLVDGE